MVEANPARNPDAELCENCPDVQQTSYGPYKIDVVPVIFREGPNQGYIDMAALSKSRHRAEHYEPCVQEGDRTDELCFNILLQTLSCCHPLFFTFEVHPNFSARLRCLNPNPVSISQLRVQKVRFINDDQ